MSPRFCGNCGVAFHDNTTNPIKCLNCKRELYSNPTSVGVLVIPVQRLHSLRPGLLLVRRGIEPKKGTLNFAGGFIVTGETIQQGTCREGLEEIGISIDPGTLEVFDVHSTPDTNRVLTFFTAPMVTLAQWDTLYKEFKPNDEVTEIGVAYDPIELGFPLHTLVMKKWFEYL